MENPTLGSIAMWAAVINVMWEPGDHRLEYDMDNLRWTLDKEFNHSINFGEW